MAWTEPGYPRQTVNSAARAYLDRANPPDVSGGALLVINNWRSSHSFPLNTMQVGLRRKARLVDPDSLVAQRTKRLSSIASKLERFPNMKLTQMQDIGGCRAIVADMPALRELHASYVEAKHKHKLNHSDVYVDGPPASGYRGIHLVYKYFSDRSTTFNDLKIELQLRTSLQHAWATAVETVGTFTSYSLKSSQGDADWLRFFSLMGSAFALREGTALVPGTPDTPEALRAELRSLTAKLDVQNRLRTFGETVHTLTSIDEGAHYYLLSLDPAAQQVSVTGFKQRELKDASERYLDLEQAIKDRPGADAVLVSVESLESLRRAYPNYFLDTKFFLDALDEALR